MREVLLELRDSRGDPVFVRCLRGGLMVYGFWSPEFAPAVSAISWSQHRDFRESRLTAHLTPIVEAALAAMENADAHARTGID